MINAEVTVKAASIYEGVLGYYKNEDSVILVTQHNEKQEDEEDESEVNGYYSIVNLSLRRFQEWMEWY